MLSRRAFLEKSLFTSLAMGLPWAPASLGAPKHADDAADFPIHIFSKNLQWLDYNGMALAAAEMGFEGVDLTVRPGGHVEPARVEADLPKAVDAVRKAGLNVFMITTAIQSADQPHTEAILKTAGALGIPYYRMGWINYHAQQSMEENLTQIAAQMKGLAEMNERYAIHGGYQNHQGANFGSSVWDLWMVLKELDSRWIGSQYDVLHATVEGANSWVLDLKLLRGYVRTFDVKDFRWEKTATGWRAQVVPLGEGMVNYAAFLKQVKDNNIRGPFSIHYEYPLGGAENGSKTLTVPRAEVMKALKRDVVTLRKMLIDAGLRS